MQKAMNLPTVAWLNGTVVPFERAAVPLEDRGLEFGESLYEVIAVTRGQARLLAEHADRMKRGAAQIGISRGVPDLEQWQAILAELQDREHLEEGYVYAQLTGGTAPRSHVPRGAPEPTFFAYLVEYRFPRADQVEIGIAAVTTRDIRWARRDLKTTMLLPAVLAKREASAAGASEALFVGPQGQVHEGAASNVFLLEGTTLVTPRQSELLLPGTTRPLVGDIARIAGLNLAEDTLLVDRLWSAQEVFVTSTTQLVMPVVSIDGRAVGGGRAGPVATDLARRVRQRLQLE